MITIFGARNASSNGRTFALNNLAGPSSVGLLVFSGLARGIDGGANRGSLAKRTGVMVASDRDVVDPPEH